MPISSLANTRSFTTTNRKKKKLPKPSQGDKFSHSILLRNRLVREYLSRFSQQKWNEAIKYAVIAGIQSFLIMEHEQNDGFVGLTLQDLEQQILRGKAAIAMKENLKQVNDALQTVKENVASMEDSIQVNDVADIVDEQPSAGRRLAKFPFVDENGGVANVLVQQEVPTPSRESLTSEKSQTIVSRILSESNRNTVGVQLNKKGKVKRGANRHPIYPGWWPDDHVTEATNRSRGMPKPKHKSRSGPRLSYSLKGANENEKKNVLENDLITEAYINVPSSGYMDGYVPKKGVKQNYTTKKSASPPAMNISTKPLTVKERILYKKKNADANAKDINVSSFKVPKYLKNVSSKVKAEVNAYKAAVRKAKREQKEVIEEIMSPARPPLPGRDYNITHNNRPYDGDNTTSSYSNKYGNPTSMDRIADAFLDEYNDLAENGPSPRDVNLDPWDDADVYVPVKTRNRGKLDISGTTSRQNGNSIITAIEKSYNESEFRSRRFRPTFQGWVGDYGAPHTRGNRGTIGGNNDDNYVDGDIVEDEITKEKTDEILKRNHSNDNEDSSLNIKNFLMPVPPPSTTDSTSKNASNLGTEDITDKNSNNTKLDNGNIGDPILLPVDLTMENETVEDTIARSQKTIEEISKVEADSEIKILEMEDSIKKTEDVVSKPLSDMVTIGQLKTMPAPETSSDNVTVALNDTKAIGGEDDNSQIVENSSNLESVDHPATDTVDIDNYNATSRGNRRGSSFGW
eukprot:g5136.t1